MIFIGSLNFKAARLMAAHLVTELGSEVLYTDINPKHRGAAGVPESYLMTDYEDVARRLKKHIQESHNLRELHIIEDPNIKKGILGLYVRQGDMCFIKTEPGLNTCWKRFAVVKELCSMYIDFFYGEGVQKYDNYLDSIRNAFELKSRFLNDSLLVDIDEGEMDSEYFSAVLATELLIPVPYREQTLNLISLHPIEDIAKSLLVPKYVLDLYVGNKLLQANP